MALIELETRTLAMLISGIYCTVHEVNPLAIPESLWLEIAEKVEYFTPSWDYEKLSFEDWVSQFLMIYPKEMINKDELKDLTENTLYWERLNGNAILIVSMDIRGLNDGE